MLCYITHLDGATEVLLDNVPCSTPSGTKSNPRLNTGHMTVGPRDRVTRKGSGWSKRGDPEDWRGDPEEWRGDPEDWRGDPEHCGQEGRLG